MTQAGTDTHRSVVELASSLDGLFTHTTHSLGGLVSAMGELVRKVLYVLGVDDQASRDNSQSCAPSSCSASVHLHLRAQHIQSRSCSSNQHLELAQDTDAGH